MNETQETKKQSKNLWIPLLIVVVLLGAYFIGPFRLVAVVSGSMEPTIPTGSLCLVNIRRPYAQIEEGDVIVYVRKSDGLRIIHRVVAVSDAGLVTRGDANSIDDGLSTTAENYYGTSLFHIPVLGKLAMKAKTPVGLAVIGAALVAVIFWPAEEKKKKEEEPQEEQK